MPQASPEAAQALGADIVTGNRDRSVLIDLVNRRLKEVGSICSIPAHERNEQYEDFSASSFERTRAFMKIEDGCDRYCSYCIIPYARGPVRSMQLSEVEKTARGLVDAGHKEIVLSGINLASYGREIGLTLADAAECAAKAGAERIRFGSVEPDLMTPDILDRLSAIPAVCPQFHLSLQSGSDSVLKRMHRRYDTALYSKTVENIRQRFYNPSFTTDIMVGFPGETQEEYDQSLAYAEIIGFLRIHVFAYSPRTGTPEANMPDQIAPAEKKKRAAKMAELGSKLAQNFYQSQVGNIVTVLAETCEIGIWEGYSENYTPVRFASVSDLRHQIVKVKIIGFDKDGCIGEIQ
jgi:threonylcarbamoyladenosine tRNA methylthiotransferase MtaB